MISKVLDSGPGFGAVIDYLIADGRELLAYANDNILSFGSAGLEMEAMAGIDGRVDGDTSRAMYHYTIAWPPSEQPSTRDMLEIALRSVAHLGLGSAVELEPDEQWSIDGDQNAMRWRLDSDHQVVVILHDDSASGHRHAHIVVNRRSMVAPHPLIDPGLDFFKMDAFCRLTEREYGFSHAPGIFEVAESNGQTELVRREKERPLNSARARTGKLMAGLATFGEWISGRAASDVRDVLDDPDSTAFDVAATLSRYGAELKPYKAGWSIVDSTNPRRRIGARFLDARLDADMIDSRYADIREQTRLPKAEQTYRDDVRRFDPNPDRDAYERARINWKNTAAGRAYRAALTDLNRQARAERKRLKNEIVEARRQAAVSADPAAYLEIAELLYAMRRADLDARLHEDRRQLRRAANDAGRPAETFFKHQQRVSDTNAAGAGGDPQRIMGARPFEGEPPLVSGYDLRPGARGTDYFRRQLRVLTLHQSEVQVLTNNPADAQAAIALATRAFGAPLTARGSERFTTQARALGVAAPRRASVT